MKYLLRYLGTVVAIMLTVYIVPGVDVSGGWFSIFVAALVWSIITIAIRPVLKLLTLPITIITFGLFSFVLNALLFWVLTAVVPGFNIAGFWPALLGALVLSVISWIINMALFPVRT